jgi:hypothetical protein
LVERFWKVRAHSQGSGSVRYHHKRLGLQSVALLGDGGTFKRWGLLKRIVEIRPLPFSLCALDAMR